MHDQHVVSSLTCENKDIIITKPDVNLNRMHQLYIAISILYE